jgi:alanine racemase
MKTLLTQAENYLSSINPSADQIPRTWLELDLDAFGHNVRTVKRFLGSNTQLLVLVKGEAYGLGRQSDIAKIALANGADIMGVELLEEACQLRSSGVQSEILMVGPINPDDAPKVVNLCIQVTVRDRKTLDEIDRLASAQGKTIAVHLELDTGLNRFGTSSKETMELALIINELRHVALQGVWTHFSSAENDQDDFIHTQYERYLAFLEDLNSKSIKVPTRHVCNSAAMLRFRDMHLDMVRCGKLLYGFEVFPGKKADLNIRNVVSWKGRITNIKNLKKGESTSYSRIWTAESDTQIGVLNVGFGDGYPSSLSNRSCVLIRGRRWPTIGRICMSGMMVHLYEDLGFKIGEEVVLVGEQGGERIDLTEIAMPAGCLSAEFVLGISHRVPRVYFLDNSPCQFEP